MNDAQSLFETANRISAVADSEEELRTAAGLMRQAAELGHGAAAGAYANMLMAGSGVSQSTQLAIRYWSCAALEHADADSAFRVGLVCRDGALGAIDPAGALAWFMIARDLGSDIVMPDIDDIQFELDETTRTDAFERYDHLRASSAQLR